MRLRELVAETRLSVDDLVAPLFVREGIDSPVPIASLPGVEQHTVASLVAEVRELADLGVRAVILFGVPSVKDHVGSGAFDPEGIVQVALRELHDAARRSRSSLMADLCVDEYTDHGHCGVLDAAGNVDNDLTLEIYAKAAIAQADAGAHVVAPSGMMDGQVGRHPSCARRRGLTTRSRSSPTRPSTRAGSTDRSATLSTSRSSVAAIARATSRTGATPERRLIEVDADIAQGADMVMVKPALSYLDVIAAVRRRIDLPVAAYHVSGEYAMVKAAAANGWIDHDTVALEQLTAVKRAGADIILTYFTRWFAERERRRVRVSSAIAQGTPL